MTLTALILLEPVFSLPSYTLPLAAHPGGDYGDGSGSVGTVRVGGVDGVYPHDAPSTQVMEWTEKGL
jgi:hypothetical protein